MVKYIKSTIDKSDQIAKIHLKSFPNFFLTTLGYSFLKTYYKSCAKRLFKNLGKGKNVNNDDGNYAELLSIGVSPDKNGLGIGQKLLVEFENKVKEKGINVITLTTDADANDNVLKFYKKSGYEVYYEFVTYPRRKMFKLIKKI